MTSEEKIADLTEKVRVLNWELIEAQEAHAKDSVLLTEALGRAIALTSELEAANQKLADEMLGQEAEGQRFTAALSLSQQNLVIVAAHFSCMREDVVRAMTDIVAKRPAVALERLKKTAEMRKAELEKRVELWKDLETAVRASDVATLAEIAVLRKIDELNNA